MSFGYYEIWLRDKTGNRLQLLDEKTLLSFQYAHSVYGEGTLTLTTSNAYPFAYLQQDGQIEVWRTSPSGTTSLLGNSVFLIDKFMQQIQGSSLPFYSISASPFVSILKRRIIAYAANTAYTNKTAAADDMMKAIIRENFGASAVDTARDISTYLACAADATAAPSISKAFSWTIIFNTLQEIAQASATAGTRLYFDVTFDTTANLPTFRTYTGQLGADNSATVIFSPDRFNLADPSLTYDYTGEQNYIYALGQGTESDRLQVTETDATRTAKSNYNRREQALNATQYSTTTGLDAEANAALYAGRPVVTVGGTLLNTEDTEYGTHWKEGDLVTAQFDTVSQTCIVESASIDIASGKESIRGVARAI